MSFEQGLSGLSAAAKNLDVIGNNVANTNTVGFKSSSVHFADIYAGAAGSVGANDAGIGTRVSAIAQSFGQGSLTATTNPLDMAINGSGFFRLSNNGAITFSRNGQFHLDKSGYVVNDNGARLTGYPAGPSGIVPTASPSELLISQADVAPLPTGKVDATVGLDSRAPALASASFDPANSTTYNFATSTSVYDSLGNAHALSMYFVPTGPGAGGENRWDVFATNDGTAVGAGAIGTLTFGSDGLIDTTATTLPFAISTPIAGGASTPLALKLDFTGSTQFGTKSGVNQLKQDGYTSGRLSSYTVSDDGIILGRYSNGQTKDLAQIALANFTSPEGLAPLGNNVWAESSKSGPPLVGAPGSASLGSLQAGTVEESNVDLTAELVNMITAQRNYQANAQTIKTQDQLMQTLVNLR
ncbi:MAG: flagellar hook protein FlgE [Burkholderiaceae bacterium]